MNLSKFVLLSVCLSLCPISSPGQSITDRLKKKAAEMLNKGTTSTQSSATASGPSVAGTAPSNGSSQSGGYPPNTSAKDLNSKPIIPDVVSSDGANYYTIATYRIDLFAIHKKPELISDEFLNAFATSQVATEQSLWNGWYKGRNGNPKNPYYKPQTWEWQSLIEEQPDFAKGPLLDTFLFPQVEWPFVKTTPDLSQTGVVVFLFARSAIDGRDESFAARELQPVVKRQLLLASERSPHALWIPLKLPFWDWDPNTNSIRFLAGNPGTPFIDFVSVLQPQLPNAETKGVPHLATYPSFYREPLNTAPQHPQEVKPGMGGLSATESWREDAFLRANGRARFPSFGILALDHKVELREIKIPVSQAEQLHLAHTKLTARLLLEMDDIGIAPKAAMNNFDSLCVYAKVKKIEIVGSNSNGRSETVILSIDGASLPVGSTMPEETATAAQAPRRTVAPANNSKTGDQAAQQTKDENARRVREFQIRKRAKTHDERIANCATFATARYPDVDSDEHKNWNDQCVKQVSDQEARSAR